MDLLDKKCKMKNLEQIINRYKNQLPDYCSSVSGYLMWGGKSYYRINSDKPVRLNSSSSGFILNPEGKVQQYSLFTRTSFSFGTRTWWGSTLDNYYPWPYFPKKQIKGFEVVRLLPKHKLGDFITVGKKADTQYKLNYPEFFKPIY